MRIMPDKNGINQKLSNQFIGEKQNILYLILYLKKCLMGCFLAVWVFFMLSYPMVFADNLIENLHIRAQAGEAESQYNLGMAYYQGQNVIADKSKAMHWFEKACEQELKEAQYMLGLLYEKGENTPVNFEKAIYYYEASAKQNYAPAQFNLGLIYFEGYGVSRDEKKGADLFKLAATSGNAKAQYRLGLAYLKGSGVEKDEITAIQWLQQASDQGYQDAKVILSILQENIQNKTIQ